MRPLRACEKTVSMSGIAVPSRSFCAFDSVMTAEREPMTVEKRTIPKMATAIANMYCLLLAGITSEPSIAMILQ